MEWENGVSWRRALVVFALVVFGASAPAANAGLDDFPEFRVTLTGPTEAVPEGQEATYVATVINEGGAAGEAVMRLSSLAFTSHDPSPNPFRSVQPSQGSCALEGDPSKAEYLSAECSTGPIGPGASVQVIAEVEVNESMRFFASVGQREEEGARVETTVQAPPEVTGSDKIKVSGLPSSGCPDGDFKLKAKAKGAEKVSATLRGPLDAGFKPATGYDEEKLAAEKSEKLTAAIPVRKLAPAYYEIKLLAKYPKGPKQETFVAFQRCG